MSNDRAEARRTDCIRRRSCRIEGRAAVSTIEKQLLKICGLGVIYILAAPILIVRWVLKLRKEVAAIERIRSGVLVCPYCAYPNPLARMATCARCRATEPASVLRCSFCKTTFQTITCDQCGATLKVL
jgi:formate dehydrogenase maturation protein FdhE